MAQQPRRRVPAGPSDTSRGTGQAAPASAAATAPPSPSALAAAAATGQPVAQPFYDSGESPQPDGAETARRAAFNDEVRRDYAGEGEHGGTADAAVVERAVAEENGEPEDLAAAIARIRSIRKPLGAFSQKLALPERQGYKRHWFNDVAGRIEEAEANGWAHVRDRDGKSISRAVGTGRDRGALFAFAMEIPLVFWQEDQDAKNAVAEEKLASLKRSPFQAPPGAAQRSDGGKFYDPTESNEGPLQVTKG